MADRKIDLPDCWLQHLAGEFDQSYMQELRAFLASEKQNGKLVYPPGPQIFNALNTTRFDDVRVVVIGQDPYHGPGQAHGLSFSVPEGVPAPPSLQNIFKELQSDVGMQMPSHGCLQQWAEQGILLLNAVLTVQHTNAGSHANKGWEQFTDRVIQALNSERQGVVFLLWGSYAQRKGAFIDEQKHCVLKAPHPSPLSAYRGFFGCKHFSGANEYLTSRGLTPIDWVL